MARRGLSIRDIRYQAAVIHNAHVLAVRVALQDGQYFWLLPGGGREPHDESGEACVEREVREETTLAVTVERLLSDVPAHPEDARYRRWRTYLCRVGDGEPRAATVDGIATIDAVRWLSLHDEGSWPPEVRGDRFLYPQLASIAATLSHDELDPKAR